MSLWRATALLRTVRGGSWRLFSQGDTTSASDTNTAVDGRHRDAEKEPLPDWPEGVHPVTRERGGPRGPEPTRYGDWERKGRVSDF